MTAEYKVSFLAKIFDNNQLLKEQYFVERIFSAPKWDKSNWIQSAYWNYEIKSGRLLKAYAER